MQEVLLHAGDDGVITSPYGPVSDLEPCVLISGWVVESTQGRDAPLCKFASGLLGPGSARTDGDVMTIESRDRTLRYRLYLAQWDDDAGRITTEPPFYLGVLQPN